MTDNERINRHEDQIEDLLFRVKILEYDMEKLLKTKHILDGSKCTNPHCDKCWSQEE